MPGSRICTDVTTPTEGPLLDRFRGSLGGVALGDSVGMPAEGLTPDEVRLRLGRITGPLPDRDRPAGSTTDDTALTIALTESLLRCRAFDQKDFAETLREAVPLAYRVGPTTLAAAGRLGMGIPHTESGLPSIGTGSIMRVAPLGLLYSHDHPTLVRTARASAAVSHNDPRALAATAAVALAVGLVVREPGIAAADLIGRLASLVRPESPALAGAIEDALAFSDRPELDALQRFGPDATVHCVLPLALAIFLRYRERPVESVLAAANLGGDSDTTGAIVGALAGAQSGWSSWPQEWREGVRDAGRLEVLATELHALHRAVGG